MIVSLELYQCMKKAVDHAIRSNGKLTPRDAMQLGVEYDALMSLYGQIFVRNLKVEIRSVSESTLKRIVDRSEQGHSLLSLANEFHFGTFKFAKLYLEAIGERDLPLSSLITDPSKISNERVRKELLQLISMDPVCSHELEQVKECLGREYEELLIDLLNQKKMCFETEADLRSRGKPKTPDILFQIPMATSCTYRDLGRKVVCSPQTPIPTPMQRNNDCTQNKNNTDKNFTNNANSPTGACSNVNSGFDGNSPHHHDSNSNSNSGSNDIGEGMGNAIGIQDEVHPSAKVVINWIDSKAMFADALTFKENLDQFRAYNNRYGRGMVIYWHGFVDDVTAMLPDDMIIVRDSFPEEWMFPTGEKADGRTPAFDHIELPAAVAR